jgi:hypothetical protein
VVVGLLVPIVGLAALDATSPTTIAVTIGVLLSGRGFVARTLVYLATVATCYFGFGVALMLGVDATIGSVDGWDLESMAPVLLPVGIALLALSFVLDPGTKAAKQRRHERAAARAAARRAAPQTDRGGGLGAMVGLGVTTFLLEFTTVLPYLAAIGLLLAAELPTSQWLSILAGYNLIMMVPSLALLAARLVLHDRIAGHLARWAEQLDASARIVAAWIVGIAGVVLALSTWQYVLR